MITVVAATNDDTQHCAYYHWSNPIVRSATCLRDSRGEHHCCGSAPKKKFLHDFLLIFHNIFIHHRSVGFNDSRTTLQRRQNGDGCNR